MVFYLKVRRHSIALYFNCFWYYDFLFLDPFKLPRNVIHNNSNFMNTVGVGALITNVHAFKRPSIFDTRRIDHAKRQNFERINKEMNASDINLPCSLHINVKHTFV